MKLLTFRTSGDCLGIESKYVCRVLEDVSIAPVCCMPDYYLGLLYYRGELFDVIDTGLLFGSGAASSSESPRIMIIRWSDKKLALAPGIIHGLIWIDQSANGGNGDAVITPDGLTIHRIEPEKIWERICRGAQRIGQRSESGEP